MQETFAPVKTAVVGCGAISSIYIRNLKNLFSIIDLRALCNRTASKAEQKCREFGIPQVMTLEEIAADPEIELVVNLTDPVSHEGVIRTMLESGKHVYTEKLFTNDLRQSAALLELAKQKNLYLGVAPDTVLGAGVQSAKKLLDSGMIGTVTSGDVSLTRNHNVLSEIFPFLRRPGGSVLYDMGPYYIGALITLLGPVKAIRAFTAPALVHEKQLMFLEQNPDFWQIPGPGLICAALEFAGGVLVSLHINGNAVGDGTSRIDLYGTEGMLHVGDPDKFGSENILVRPENPPVTMPLTHGYNGVNMISEPKPYDGGGHRGVGVAEMAYAIRQCRPNRLSGEYGLHCQEVLTGIEQAARTGETYVVSSSCSVAPLRSGFYSTFRGGRADAERSLID